MDAFKSTVTWQSIQAKLGDESGLVAVDFQDKVAKSGHLCMGKSISHMIVYPQKVMSINNDIVVSYSEKQFSDQLHNMQVL